MASLLAVDLGVRTGLALFGNDGRLRWYRSQNFGSAVRLKRAIPSLLDEPGDLAYVVIEGGGDLARPWNTSAADRAIPVLLTTAEAWRARFLYARDQRTGEQAKRRAASLARQVIEWSHAKRATSLRHDAAEAILVGLWGVLEVGWLADAPPLSLVGG